MSLVRFRQSGVFLLVLGLSMDFFSIFLFSSLPLLLSDVGFNHEGTQTGSGQVEEFNYTL